MVLRHASQGFHVTMKMAATKNNHFNYRQQEQTAAAMVPEQASRHASRGHPFQITHRRFDNGLDSSGANYHFDSNHDNSVPEQTVERMAPPAGSTGVPTRLPRPLCDNGHGNSEVIFQMTKTAIQRQ